jgi:NAD(P)H-dependent nitrite reductase small subunit
MTDNRIRVCRADEIPDGGARVASAGARRIAVFRAGGAFYAIKDVCPHEAAPLHDGPVRDGAVTCRNHGWRFDLASGTCLNQPDRRVSTYRLEVEDGVVYVCP